VPVTTVDTESTSTIWWDPDDTLPPTGGGNTVPALWAVGLMFVGLAAAAAARWGR
jgi:hypothetical protein